MYWFFLFIYTQCTCDKYQSYSKSKWFARSQRNQFTHRLGLWLGSLADGDIIPTSRGKHAKGVLHHVAGFFFVRSGTTSKKRVRKSLRYRKVCRLVRSHHLLLTQSIVPGLRGDTKCMWSS